VNAADSNRAATDADLGNIGRCPLCHAPVPGPAHDDAQDLPTSPEWSSASRRSADLFQHSPPEAGLGWLDTSARHLLALLLWASAYDRQEPITTVPWSSVRARMIFPPDVLRLYLIKVTRHADSTGAPAAAQASAAIDDLSRHHLPSLCFDEDGGPDANDNFSNGLPRATTVLDTALLTERGGYAMHSNAEVLTPLGGPPVDGVVVCPLWEQRVPDGRPNMLDLADGPPMGYTVRLYGDIKLDVEATAIRVLPPTGGGPDE
jgi:hypothetical protein